MTQDEQPTRPAGELGPRFRGWQHPRYEVLEELSRGGMGAVLRARHRQLGREVAIKVILDAEPSAKVLARFEREAQTLAGLEHPGIVTVLDYGRENGQHFLTMPILRGRDLKAVVGERLRTAGEAPPLNWLASVFAQIAEALTYCHARGVIHRDLKPANVLIQEDDGRPIVLDFGLVKDQQRDADSLSKTGEVMGTPGFMAPEQLDTSFGPVGPAADVWAFGATLFYCLTGKAPFHGTTVVNIYTALLSKPAPRVRSLAPGVPAWLDDLCASCLQKQSDARPGLEEVAARLREPAGANGAKRAARGWALAVVAVLLAVGGAAFAYLRPRAPSTPPALQLASLPARTKRATLDVAGAVDREGCLVFLGERPVPLIGKTFRLDQPLAVGGNVFVLRVRHEASGQETERTLRVERVGEFIVGGGEGADFADLARAIRDAPSGVTLLLQAGRHPVEGVVVDEALTLAAADPEGGEVIVEGKAATTLTIVAPGVILRGLSIRLLPLPTQTLTSAVEIASQDVLVEDCVVEAGTNRAVVLRAGTRASAILRRCKLQRSSSGLSSDEATAVLEDCDVSLNSHGGINVSGGAVTLRGCRVHDNGERGVYARGGAHLVLERCFVSKSPKEGVLTQDGATASLLGTHVFDNAGDGVFADGGTSKLVRCQLYRNKRAGVVGVNGAVVELDGIKANENANGLYVTRASRAEVRSSRFEHNRKFGIALADRSTVTIRDAFLADNRIGLGVKNGCTARVSGLTTTGNVRAIEVGPEGTLLRE